MKWFLPLLLFVQLAAAQSPTVLFFRATAAASSGPCDGLEDCPTNYPNLFMWMAASDINTNDGAPVTNWISRVNNHEWTNMNVGTTLPIYKTSGLTSGFPALTFRGGGGAGTISNQFMHIKASDLRLPIAGAQGNSVFIVGVYTNDTVVLSGFGAFVDMGLIVNQLGRNESWLLVGPGNWKEADFGYGQNFPRVDGWGWTNGNVQYITQNLTNGLHGGTAFASELYIPHMIDGSYSLNTWANISEILVFTNYMLTATERTNLYHKYFRQKYPFLPDVE
jgi:hypothetical protein